MKAHGIGDDVEEDEKLDKQRGSADEFDVDGGEPAQCGIGRAASEGGKESKDDAQDERGGGDPDGVEPAAPEDFPVGPDAGPVPADGLEDGEAGGGEENGAEEDGDDRVDGVVAGHGRMGPADIVRRYKLVDFASRQRSSRPSEIKSSSF